MPVTTAAAAAQANVTVATIRAWCRNGVVAAAKAAGRWVIDAASLARRIAIGALRRARKETTVTEPAELKVPWDDAHPDRGLLNRAIAIGVPLADIIRISHLSELEMGRSLRRREEGAINRLIDERRENLATDRQVRYILDLIDERRSDGDTSGFYNGPTGQAEIEKLTRREASTYIDSLKGNY